MAASIETKERVSQTFIWAWEIYDESGQEKFLFLNNLLQDIKNEILLLNPPTVNYLNGRLIALSLPSDSKLLPLVQDIFQLIELRDKLTPVLKTEQVVSVIVRCDVSVRKNLVDVLQTIPQDARAPGTSKTKLPAVIVIYNTLLDCFPDMMLNEAVLLQEIINNLDLFSYAREALGIHIYFHNIHTWDDLRAVLSYLHSLEAPMREKILEEVESMHGTDDEESLTGEQIVEELRAIEAELKGERNGSHNIVTSPVADSDDDSFLLCND